MNTTTLLCYIIIAGVAFWQLAQLYYKIHLMEKNMDAMMDLVETIVRKMPEKKVENNR